jgi:hypothetical protein
MLERRKSDRPINNIWVARASCTMLKVGMKVLSDNNCELLVLDKSDKKQGS